MACANLRKVIDARTHRYFEEYVAEPETLLADNNQRDFYKHLKCAVGLKDQRARGGQFIMAGEGKMLRETAHIRERWASFITPSCTRNNKKSQENA